MYRAALFNISRSSSVRCNWDLSLRISRFASSNSAPEHRIYRVCGVDPFVKAMCRNTKAIGGVGNGIPTLGDRSYDFVLNSGVYVDCSYDSPMLVS